MSNKRITDTARLDWLIEHKAAITYQPRQIGAGWIRTEAWFVRVGKDTAESGATLRAAIDGAMSQRSLAEEAQYVE